MTMKSTMKTLVDVVYRYKTKLKNFQDKYPKDTIIAYGGCKGIKLNNDRNVKSGLKWLLSRRGFFILTNKRIVLGNWEILIDDVKRAELVKGGGGMILKIAKSESEHYQFGLQHINELLDQNVLDIAIVKHSVNVSIHSIIIRIALAAYIGYTLFKW